MSKTPGKLFLVSALLAAALSGCVSLIPPDPHKAFVGHDAPRFHSYAVLGRKIFAAEIGPKDGPPVLFVHGSPGSWGVAASLMTDPTLVERAHLIAIDRPGFGRSGAGLLETSLLRQAAMLKKVLDQAAPGRKVIVAGRELEKMLPLWGKIRIPVEIIQGDADALVPPENADFAARMLTRTSVRLTRVPNQGHEIPFERPDLIRDAIVRLLDGER